MLATATFSDATREYVTPWTVSQPSDPSSLQLLNDPVRVKVLRTGRHVMVARYLDQVVPIVFTLPLTSKPLAHVDRVQANYIDHYIDDGR